jgi:hypothetical protein
VETSLRKILLAKDLNNRWARTHESSKASDLNSSQLLTVSFVLYKKWT